MSYYSTKNIDKKNATYNVIFGERSNGKTYALLKKAIENYVNGKGEFAYLRRWKEDVTGRRAQQLFGGLKDSGEISKLTKGEYQGVHYYSGKFYFCNYDDNGKVVYNSFEPIGYTFSLSDSEHNKSTSYPKVNLIIFDEFLTNRIYMNDEFVIFMNTISTIVRRRKGVKIYMLGNTISKYCPYFAEMGLANVRLMKQGTIDIYRYGESGLTVAVEYCKTTDEKGKAISNSYFAFNNPKLQMITGGSWELDLYPHLPMKYKPSDVLLEFFIEFNDDIFSCEVIEKDNNHFIYIHQKTTPIKDTNNSLIYSLDYNPKPNYNRNIYKPLSKMQQKITQFFNADKVFYQDNNVGDAIHNYLKICKRL